MRTLYPLAIEGETIVFITDTHSGKGAYSIHYPGESGVSGPTPEGWRPRWDFTEAQHTAMGVDLDDLARRAKAVGIGGDLIDWGYNPATPNTAAGDPAGFIAAAVQDAQFMRFYNARTEREKYCVTTGNHDLASFNSRVDRTGDAWAASVKLPKYDSKPVAGKGVQIVGLSQETQSYADGEEGGRGFALSDNPSNPLDTKTALGYLRARVATGRPTWINIHYPMRQQYPATRFDEATHIALTKIIAGSDNVLGVLSGHRHANPFTDTAHASEVSYSDNGRTVVTAGINAAASGGQMAGSFEYPWDSPFVATVLTYRPGRVIVRWRDLIARTWLRGLGGQYYKELSVSCAVPI